MRISTKGRHAVMAMVDLAGNAKQGPVSLAEIARRQDISLSYLEQLISRLKRAGLVKSVRGPGGGYMLVLPSEQITAYQIVKAVDGEQSRARIDDSTYAGSRALTDLLWQAINDEVDGYLKTITLEDIALSAFPASPYVPETREKDESEVENGITTVIQLPDLSGEAGLHAA